MHQHFLEHRAIEAIGVLTKVRERELRLEVEQRRQIAAAGLEVHEHALVLVASDDGGDIRGQRARPGTAAGGENREKAAGRLRRVQFIAEARQAGIELGVELFLIQKVFGAAGG